MTSNEIEQGLQVSGGSILSQNRINIIHQPDPSVALSQISISYPRIEAASYSIKQDDTLNSLNKYVTTSTGEKIKLLDLISTRDLALLLIAEHKNPDTHLLQNLTFYHNHCKTQNDNISNVEFELKDISLYLKGQHIKYRFMLSDRYLEILVDTKILEPLGSKYKFTNRGIEVFEEIKKTFSSNIQELRSHPITKSILTKDFSIGHSIGHKYSSKKELAPNKLSPDEEFRELQYGYSEDLF